MGSERVQTKFTSREYTSYPECDNMPADLYSWHYDDHFETEVVHSRRPRPTTQSDLIKNPTALEEQYTYRLRTGCFEYDEYCYPSSCYVGGKYSNTNMCRVDRARFSLTYDGVRRHQPTDWPLALRLKIKARKVNLGTSLVEYRQTEKMFGNFAKGVKTAWRSYRNVRTNLLVSKRRRRKSGRRKITPCDIPASYLTATYGLEPLIGDLMDSIHALTKRLEKPIYQRFAVKRTSDIYEALGIKWQTQEKAVAYLRSTSAAGFDEFTLGDARELAWEVVPFSFVIDWGIGIGDWLSSLDALDGMEFISGTVTRKTTAEGSKTLSWAGGKNLFPAIFELKSHNRRVISSIPVPQRPRIGFSKSYRRLVNATALLWAVNDKCSNTPIR